MEDVSIIKNGSELILNLPSKNKGKFRWKNRSANDEFGYGFATATVPYNDNSYIEWQIGYDSEINHETKVTILNKLVFIGANGKKKNPYELSEILYLMIDSKIVTKAQIKKLKAEIEKEVFSFNDDYQIKNSKSEKVVVAKHSFRRHDIILPTFSSYDAPLDPSIEISIQKQQYASGVQPMVYFCIPIKNFMNYESAINKTSSATKHFSFSINKSNSDLILRMFKLFGMCSSNHKHDILEILKLLEV